MATSNLFKSQLKIYKNVIFIRAFTLIISILSNVLFAIELGKITSMILSENDAIATNFIFVFVLFLMIILVNPYLMYKSNQAIFKKSINGDESIFHQFLNEDPQSIGRWNSGELSSKIVDNAIEYRWAIIDFFSYSIEVIVLILILVFFMIQYSWYYMSFVVLLVIIGSGLTKYCSSIQAENKQMKMEADQKINDSIFQAINDFIVIRINRFTSLVLNSVQHLFENTYKHTYLNNIKADNKVNLYTLVFEMFAYISILLFGVFLVKQGKIEVGDVLTVSLIFPIFSNEVQHIQAIQKAKKMMKLMNEEMNEFLSHPIKTITGQFESLKLKQCRYSYDQKKYYEFDDISINKEDKVAIVGDNGVGKTTLLNILCGLYEICEGEMLLNDKTYSREILRTLCTYLDAESFMFDDMLENYITANLNKKLDETYIKEFNLKEKLNQFSGELSGGERKRADFIRALLEKRDILVLDEPEVFLDEEWKEKMIQLLAESNQTIIYTTHDEQFIGLATKIIYIK